MWLPGKNRAFWSRSEYCRKCKQHRPWFFFPENYDGRGLCKVHYREETAARIRKYKAKNAEKVRKKNLDVINERPRSLMRCRSIYYRLRKRNLVPRWVTIESLLPIYEYAEQLEQENPGYKYWVSHVLPLANSDEVCGLHTIDNLRIVKRKKPSAEGSSRNDPS